MVLALTGCGGTTIGNGQVAGGGAGQPGTQTVFPVGQATYSGFLTLGFLNGASNVTATGDLAVAVNFTSAGGSFTGVAQGFNLSTNHALTGRLFVTAGQISQNAVGGPIDVDAGVSGTLVGATLPNSVFTGTITGGFQAIGFDVIQGTTTGDLTTASGIGTFTGSFAVAKQ